MSDGNRPRKPADEEVVYLDDSGGDDVAEALADAERAVTAIEERHKVPPATAPRPEVTWGEPIVMETEDVAEGAPVPTPKSAAQGPHLVELNRAVAEEHERAVKAEEEAGKIREALLRKAADFENLKKRVEKEKADHYRFALTEVFRELLVVLDNFERARVHAEGVVSTEEFRVGIDMIARQLTETLKKYGVTEVPALMQPFDPNVHEAVMRWETDEAPPGTVLEVFQRGYVLNDRLLRPAMVRVAAAPTPKADGVEPESPAGG